MEYAELAAALFLSALSVVESSCPRGCVCETEVTELKCHIPAARSLPGFEFPVNLTKLDLADNNILDVPPGSLAQLSHMEEINLDGNKIYFLEDGSFKGASQLRRVSLTDNNIHNIGKNVFGHLLHLEELDLKKNQLTDFPDVESNLNLVKLSLCYNRLEAIGKLKENTKLQELTLKSNKIKILPRESFPEDLSNYRILDLSQNQLWDTPEGIKEMSGLESLSLSGNPLKVLRPQDFRPLSSLKRLLLSHIGMSEIPENLFWLPNLEELDISNNKITGATLSSLRFPRLRTMNLKGNPLATLRRTSFDSLSSLETLIASSCEISGTDFQAFNSLRGLKKLHLQNNRLTDIPRLQINTDLEELLLGQNMISSLSTRLSSLSKLKTLSLANNSLTSFRGAASDDFSSLLHLDLCGNRLSRIPLVFSRSMNKLETLDLSNNLLVHIPENAFDGLINLDTLNLKNNRFSVIEGDKFSQLQNLEHLYLCHNNLTSLEGMLSKLPALKEITVNDNKIREITKATFAGCPSLKAVSLKNNDIHFIEADAFSSLSNLTELMLIYNKLTKPPNLSANHKLKTIGLCNNPLGNLSSGALLGPDALEFVFLRSLGMSAFDQNVFGDVRNIRYLHLAYDNDLKSIPTVVRNMTSLRVLKLTGNPIRNVCMKDFLRLSNLRELRLDNMLLSSMDVTKLFPALPGIRTLYLAGNPWQCDCEMQWYSLGIDGTRARVSTMDRESLICSGPGSVAGKHFDFLRLGDFGHCLESRVTALTDTTALVSLPNLGKLTKDHVKLYNKVYYAPLKGRKEKTLMIEMHHREVRLSQLSPSTQYLVCVSTVVQTPHIVESATAPTSDGMSMAALPNENGISPRESCLRFTTLTSKVRNPWSQNEKKSSLDPQYLILVYAVLGGTLGVVVITVVISYVTWCKRARPGLSDSVTAFADIGNSGSHENTQERSETQSEEAGDADIDKSAKVGRKKRTKNQKIKRKKGKETARDQAQDANGGVVEMTNETSPGRVNEACEVVAEGTPF